MLELVAGTKEPCVLDRSTILWALACMERFSPIARRAVISVALVVSVASWEPIDWWNLAAKQLAAQVLSIRNTHLRFAETNSRLFADDSAPRR